MSFFSDPGKFYSAAPYTFLFAAVIILIFGPGRFALDTLIAQRYDSAQAPEQGRTLHPANHADAA
jgi:putative oxidoreductase